MGLKVTWGSLHHDFWIQNYSLGCIQDLWLCRICRWGQSHPAAYALTRGSRMPLENINFGLRSFLFISWLIIPQMCQMCCWVVYVIAYLFLMLDTYCIYTPDIIIDLVLVISWVLSDLNASNCTHTVYNHSVYLIYLISRGGGEYILEANAPPGPL